MSNNFAWQPWTTTSTSTISNSTLVYNDNWSAVYQPPPSVVYWPESIQRARDVPEGAAIPETPQQWLKRRVAEIAWRPE